MRVRFSKEFSGHGQIIAIHMGGIRYGLSSMGNPQDPAFNLRATRRDLRFPQDAPSTIAPIVSPLPLSAGIFGDLETPAPDFGAKLLEPLDFPLPSTPPDDEFNLFNDSDDWPFG
jgi:hypothetical protein